MHQNLAKQHKKLKHSNTKLSTKNGQFLQSYITKVLNQVDKECTEFCCQFCSFQVEAWKRRLLKHRRPYICSLQPACPHSVQCSLSGDASPTRPSAGDHCCPPQASSSFHVVFVVLPPSFVSPKLQVFNQRLFYGCVHDSVPVSRKYTHPVNIGTPGFPFSRDFRYPVVIIGTPFDCKW